MTGALWYQTMVLSHNGEFGASITLTVPLGEKMAGKYANLFYYNETTGKLEYIQSNKIDEAGKASFTLTHASQYVIYVSEAAMSQDSVVSTPAASDTSATAVAKTGDNTQLTGYYLMLMTATLALVQLSRKKMAKQEWKSGHRI